MKNSRLSGFHRLSMAERIDVLVERGWLDDATAAELRHGATVQQPAIADRMIENVIAVFGLPLAVAPNFTINGEDRVVPMVVEEPSIVAGVSAAARLARAGGGFRVATSEPLLIGQILLVDVEDPDAAASRIEAAKEKLLSAGNELQPKLVGRGGGLRDIESMRLAMPGRDDALLVHLLVDTRDAMGANLVNSLCEALAPAIEKAAGGRAALRILSNLADRALVSARVRIPVRMLAAADRPGEQVRDAIVLANDFARADPYRAATHNKGIMNGIDALAIATGNDWRSLEAAAHAYAARDGAYRALTEWTVDDGGDLAGRLEMPIKVGTVGGSLLSNPAVAIALRMAGVAGATELAGMMGAVGLAQNLAALRALVTEGIQRGHMSLHARSVAASVGTPEEHFDRVVSELIRSGEIKAWKADEILRDARVTADQERRALEVHGKAAGKVILLGEHGAVYGRHVLALPIPDAMHASVTETQGATELTLVEAGREHRVPVPAGSDEGVAGIVAFILQRLGLDDRHFDLKLLSRVPAAMGLGSSAALSVAVIRALDNLHSLGLDDAAVNDLAFECEKLAHGDPSGIDNTLATYGKPVLYRKGEPAQTLLLAGPVPLVIAASGIRGITLDLVAAVRQRYQRSRRRYEAIFDEMDAISLAGAEALTGGEYDVLGDLMNICHGLLNALQVSTPVLERMVDIARANGALGAKLTGAGGGGSIVALCPGDRERVESALRTAGFRIVGMQPD